MQKIFKILNNIKSEHISYLVVNIFVSFVGLLRSIIFMKYLNMKDLGLISLIQTVVLFLGLLQFGLINGGYRIFSLKKTEEQVSVNNLLFTFFGFFSIIFLLSWITLSLFEIQLIMDHWILLIAIICGIFSLITNWLTITLIGNQKIREINKINLLSASISLGILPSVAFWNIYGAIASLILQPFLFVTFSLITYKYLRPNALCFNLKLVKRILSYGFIPFLAGVFVIVNIQIERWSIAQILGTEELGNYYLIFLYSTLINLLPSSLLNIVFPKTIYFYENNNFSAFKKLLFKYTGINIIYLVVIGLITTFFLQFFIDWLLPSHSGNTKYVFMYLPGLIANILSNTFSLIFNSTLQLKPLLIGGLLSVLFTSIFLYFLYQCNFFSLINITLSKSIINIIILLYYLFYVAINVPLKLRRC